MADENTRLTGKLAVISGASKGLGRALALRLAGEGAKLVLLARSEDALMTLQQQIQRDFPQAEQHVWIFPLDLADRQTVMDVARRIKQECPPVALLVNNAGMGYYKPFLEHSADEHDQILAVNVHGLVHLTYSLLPAMLAAGSGHIINIASDLSFTPLANMAVYAASKFAVRGFTLSLAKEVKDSGVKVSLVNPGIIDTEFNNAKQGSKDPTWALQPDQLAELVLAVATQPGYQMIDEITVHPQMQQY